MLLTIISPAQKKSRVPEPFPATIVAMLEQGKYTFDVKSVTSVSPRLTNSHSVPASYLTREQSLLVVYLPYYNKQNIRQNSDNFSALGRLLDFRTRDFKISKSSLNKKGTQYYQKIEARTENYPGVTFDLAITVNADLTALVTVSWSGHSESYQGTISSN